MGRKALLTLACCLAFSDTLGDAAVADGELGALKDNISEESVSRLYRNAPADTYASASPYAAYSYHIPTLVAAPSNLRVIPVNEGGVIVQNGFLKDSYGNRFANSPQTFGLEATFPQQFVQLQDLPAHLSQPLVSAAHNFQFKQTTPHFFGPGQSGFSALQSLTHAPVNRYAAVTQNENIRSFAPLPVPQNQFNAHPIVQQQSTSNKAVYVNTQGHEQNKLKGGPKFQRLEMNPEIARVVNQKFVHPQSFQVDKERLQAAPAEETKVTTYVNGKKTVVTLNTQPLLPLLDLSLLEPLTFENPLVPQVQHFLPKISEATYSKFPVYNAANKKKQSTGKGKSKTNNTKKKQKRPPVQDEIELQNPAVTVKGNPNDGPEYSYEINSPNYKETYKEKKLSYNKETQSEPVTYSYDEKTQSKPIHYSYEKQVMKEPVHYSYTSNEPRNENQVQQEKREKEPKHLIYTFKPDEIDEEQIQTPKAKHNPPKESTLELSEEVEQENPAPPQRETPHHTSDKIEQEQYADAPQSPQHVKLEYREEEYNERNNQESENLVSHHLQPKEQSKHVTSEEQQNENEQSEERNAHIKVDPSQHIQKLDEDRPEDTHHRHQSYPQNMMIHEKSKRVIIKEETPEGVRSHSEQLAAEMIKKEENNEEDFEKAYKNSAYGFPAYELSAEKNIYNPEAYGVSHENIQYDVEHIPFQQYQEEGDKYPKYTRANYKDARDKTKEDYFHDFSLNKPGSMTDRYRKKEDYYKTYLKHTPEKYLAFESGQEKENNKEKAKYTAAPVYSFQATEQKPQQYFAKLKAAPYNFEYNYSKDKPRDNSAFGSQSHQRFKTKTQFVEPQFQYGFEPLNIPRLLDSELATMASNHSPESERPGTRKKIYKENWYIKKTSTSGRNPAS